MPKERFSAFDVCAEVSCLRRTVLGLWCAQIYDAEGGKNALLFKFNRGGGGGGGGGDGEDDNENESSKVHLFVQPGVKLVATRYPRTIQTTTTETTTSSPTVQFVQKLRKHCAKKRLNDIRQLGMDRAVVLTFGAKETETKLVVELYASGNAILCDREFYGVDGAENSRGEDEEREDNGEKKVPSRTVSSVSDADERDVGGCAERSVRGRRTRGVECRLFGGRERRGHSGEEEKKRRERERLENIRAPQTLRECLCRGFSFAPAQCEHVALRAGVEKGMFASLPLASEEAKEKVFQCIEEEFAWFRDVTEGNVFPIPEVTCKELAMEPFVNAGQEEDEKQRGQKKKEQKSVEVFDDFSPHPMKQNEKKRTVSIDEILGRNCGKEREKIDARNVFNDVLDEYYAKLEMQQGIVQRNRAEAQALKKFDKLKKDQENRLKVLERDAEKEAQRAELISRNIEDVENVLNAVNDALASGMAWDDLESMISEEKRRGNPVAKFISSLDLKNNQVTIKLTPKEDVEIDETSGEEVVVKKHKPIDIPLDLGLSAFANCNARFRGEEKTRHETRQDGKTPRQSRIGCRKESVDKNRGSERESYSRCESRANSFLVRKVHLVGHLGELFGFTRDR